MSYTSVDLDHGQLLLSEDFQNGFTWRGVTVVAPFATQRSVLLAGFLQSSD